MELKIAKHIKLTHDQVKELHLITTEPDNGWETDYNNLGGNMKANVYEVELKTDVATYHYRVNLSFQLITLLEVK